MLFQALDNKKECYAIYCNDTLYHYPNNLDLTHTWSYTPHFDDKDVEYAKRIIREWEKAESEGRGSLSLDGKMVDVPVVKRAENLLAFVDQINSQG